MSLRKAPRMRTRAQGSSGARRKSDSRKKGGLGLGNIVGAVGGMVTDLIGSQPDYKTNESANYKPRKSNGMPAPAPRPRVSVQEGEFEFKRNKQVAQRREQMPQRRNTSRREDRHSLYRMFGETEIRCSEVESFVLKMLGISIPQHLNGPDGRTTLEEVRTTLRTAIDDALRMNQDFVMEDLRGRVKTLFLEVEEDSMDDDGYMERHLVYWQFFFMPSKVSKHLNISYCRMKSSGHYRAVAADIKRELQEAISQNIIGEHQRMLEAEERRNMREAQRRPQAILHGGLNSMETDALAVGAVGSGYRQPNNAGQLALPSVPSQQNGSHKPMGGASHHALPAGGVGLALESSPHQPVLSHASGGVAHRPAIQGGELAPYPGHAEGGFSGGVDHHGAIHGGEVAPYAGDANRAQQRYRTLPESGRDLMLRRSMEEDEESMQSL